MSCDGLTLAKLIFGYTPRVVLPPQQPVSNATIRWNRHRDGEKTFPTITITKAFAIHIRYARRRFIDHPVLPPDPDPTVPLVNGQSIGN